MLKQQVPYAHPAWIEVDLGQLRQNIKAIQQFVQGRKICLPIKANGYGHGMIPIAKAAEEMGVTYLAVSCLQEGVLLRNAGIRCRILVFGPIYHNQVKAFVEHQLEVTVSSLEKAKILCENLLEKQTLKVHVEVDTGMRRTGIRIDSADAVLDYIDAQPCLILVGVYSHLATADQPDNPFALKQLDDFIQFLKAIKPRYPQVLRHLANSGGMLYYPESHLDMVRPGKLVFGYSDATQSLTRPIFSVKAKVAYFKVVKAGQGISYGHTFVTKQDTRIVTVPIGYGDGYRRALSNKAQVLIHGKRYPVVGTICMDQIMVDIGQDSAYVGDEVVLVGHQGSEQVSLKELATWCDTIPSEILCHFNDRLPRYYHDADEGYWAYKS